MSGNDSGANRWIVVREVISSTNDGAQVMSALPGLVRRLIDENAWRCFRAPGSGEMVEHATFAEFVRANPPKGLGGRERQLLALCGDDKELTALVQGLLDEGVSPAAGLGEVGNGRSRVGDTNPTSEVANQREHVIARLKRDDPATAERVMRGELSANAAALAKGWRKPRIVVSSPDRVADSLRRHMSADDLRLLAALLSGEAPS